MVYKSNADIELIHLTKLLQNKLSLLIKPLKDPEIKVEDEISAEDLEREIKTEILTTFQSIQKKRINFLIINCKL